MIPLITEMVRLLGDMASESTWFDVDDVSDVYHKDSAEALKFTPLPFDRCNVVWHDADGYKTMLALYQKGDVLVMNAHVIRANSYKSTPPFSLYWHEGERKRLPDDVSKNDATEDEINFVCSMAGRFLCVLNTIDTAYQPTVKANSLTNKRRIAHGKPPLIYDWHTVKLVPNVAPKAEPQGGTHATPRRHQCRGHWRNCKSGKRVWVKDCWRGDASKGTVFKDYEVKK